jgi:hypothetical protein
VLRADLLEDMILHTGLIGAQRIPTENIKGVYLDELIA